MQGPVVFPKTEFQRQGIPVPRQGADSIHGSETKSHMPCSQKPKTLNRSDIVTNAIKTLEMIHIRNKRKYFEKVFIWITEIWGRGGGKPLNFFSRQVPPLPYPSPNPLTTSCVSSSQNLSFGCFLSSSLLL